MASFPPKRGAATGSARPKTASKLPTPTASEDDDEDTISSSTISLQLESTVTSSVRPENRQNNQAVALPIKTPLSPKRTNLRKRHSSAEVCKFSRQIMTVQFKFQHFLILPQHQYWHNFSRQITPMLCISRLRLVI